MSEQNRSYFYRIADLAMQIRVPDEFRVDRLLPSFAPFRMDESSMDVICTICFVSKLTIEEADEPVLLTALSPTWNDRLRFYRGEKHYIMTIDGEAGSEMSVMKSSLSFHRAEILLGEQQEDAQRKLAAWMVMVVFAQRGIGYGAILLHASVVVRKGEGYAFLGESGTGKSTHSKLWRAHLQDVELLNDDNPVVRIAGREKVMIYGSPWSGKTPCYRNCGRPLKALVRLEQAPANRLTRLEGKEALTAVLPSCTVIRWDKKRFDTMLDTLQRVLHTVVVARMECLPDADAAIQCYNGLLNN